MEKNQIFTQTAIAGVAAFLASLLGTFVKCNLNHVPFTPDWTLTGLTTIACTVGAFIGLSLRKK